MERKLVGPIPGRQSQATAVAGIKKMLTRRSMKLKGTQYSDSLVQITSKLPRASISAQAEEELAAVHMLQQPYRRPVIQIHLFVVM